MRPEGEWIGPGAVKARAIGAGHEFWVNSVTSQARVYKEKLRHLLRVDYPVRPRWDEFEVEIIITLTPGLPAVDLDNVAKAVLDGIKGAVFFDDAQVMRLLVEKVPGQTEGVLVRATPRLGTADEWAMDARG
ncbi:MAG: RusA family crossover junction endodeoxyribonuclease [Hyphomonadaceae bacterium]|jgi:Holliday junction resolvase RusA-like endonuclease|nr:RusA family crossover junction endodeoxyribonuclease [Hyphomonadaceae bacterium]